jgi:hypothetical protein
MYKNMSKCGTFNTTQAEKDDDMHKMSKIITEITICLSSDICAKKTLGQYYLEK